MDEQSSQALLVAADKLATKPLWFGLTFRGVWVVLFLNSLPVLTALPSWAAPGIVKMSISGVCVMITVILYVLPVKPPRRWLPDYATIIVYSEFRMVLALNHLKPFIALLFSFIPFKLFILGGVFFSLFYLLGLIQNLPTLINNILSALLISVAGKSIDSDFVRLFLGVALSVVLNLIAGSCTFLEPTLLPVSNAAAILSFAFLFGPRQFLLILYMEPENQFEPSFLVATLANTAIMVVMQVLPILVLSSPALLEHHVHLYPGANLRSSGKKRRSSWLNACRSAYKFCVRATFHLFLRLYCEENTNIWLTGLGRFYRCGCGRGAANREAAVDSMEENQPEKTRKTAQTSRKIKPRSNVVVPFMSIQKSVHVASEPVQTDSRPEIIGVEARNRKDEREENMQGVLFVDRRPSLDSKNASDSRNKEVGADGPPSSSKFGDAEPPSYPPWEPLLRSPARGLYKARTSAIFTMISYVVNFLSIASLILTERILRDANFFLADDAARTPLLLDIQHRQFVRGLDKATASWRYTGFAIGRLALIMLSGLAAFAFTEYIMYLRLEKQRGMDPPKAGVTDGTRGGPQRDGIESETPFSTGRSQFMALEALSNRPILPRQSAVAAEIPQMEDTLRLSYPKNNTVTKSDRSMNTISTLDPGGRKRKVSERLNGLFKVGWEVDWRNGDIRYAEVACLRVYEQAVQPNVVFLLSTCVFQLMHMTLYR
jgi:hypothetical protein